MKYWTLSAVVLSAGLLSAVTPGSWQNQTEADFSSGEFEKTAVSSRGEVSLARAVKVLVGAKEAPVVVSAVAVVGKDLYAASGSSSDIYKVTGPKAAKFATVPGTIVACLTTSGKALLAGTGGKDAGVYSVAADGKVAKVWSDPAVKYVWAIAAGDKGVLYAATGPKATVFEVREGKGTALYEISKHAKNILSLAVGAGGKLYAGTDRKGLVLEIDPKRKTGRVILDAAEKEIAALIPDAAGGLFVATSDAAKASADGKMQPAKTKNGKAAAPKAKPIRPAAGKVSAKPGTKPAKSAGKAAPGPKTKGKTAAPKGKAKASAGKEKQKKKPAAKGKATAGKTAVSSRKRPTAPPGIVSRMSRSRRMMSSRPTRRPSSGGRGNAVYYIQPNGLVRTIFRKPVTILAMMVLDETLLLGTGNGGAIYSVSLDGDVSTKLADTDARQVTSLALMGDGRIAFATANKGSVATLGAAFAPEGTFLSKVMDAKQIAQWGTHSGRASVPPGTKVTLATRSGNLGKADEATWSPWSAEQPLGNNYLPIRSPAGRFLQYRLKLTSRGKASPTVHRMHLIYQVGNLAPALSAITVKVTASRDGRSRGTTGGAKSYRQLVIAARDPNGDKIGFTVEYRPLGGANWIRIGKDLAKPMYIWNTRTVGDGDYEIRVTASDKPANPPARALEAARITEPIRVDNTSPVLKRLGARAQGPIVSVRGEVTDATSRLASIRYAVDSAEKWVAVLPSDGITDSRSERFSFEIDDLKPGPHGITVQALDLYGNVGTQSTTVVVPKPRP